MSIPEPEAKHLITGNETLVVLEYPEELKPQEAEALRAQWTTAGHKAPIILDEGARLTILSPKLSDVVVLETTFVMRDEEMARAAKFLRLTLEAAGLHNPVLVTDAECKTYTPDEAAMRRLGWVRVEKEEKTPGVKIWIERTE